MTDFIDLSASHPQVTTWIPRVAVRGVALDGDGRILLLRATSDGVLKFPGGGVEPGEDQATALDRELREECGREVTAVHQELVRTLETRPNRQQPSTGLRMMSHYWLCEVSEVRHETALEQYEAELGLTPEWWPIAQAWQHSDSLRGSEISPWVERESDALAWLLAHPDALIPAATT